MEPVVSFVGVTRRFGDKLVLDSVSFSIADGERIGILGPNGTGKTTLLKTLVGEELPEGGSVARKRACVTGYVPQTPTFPPGETVRATVASGQGPLRALLAKADDARHALVEAKDPVASAKRARELQTLEEEIDRIGGWDPDRDVARAIQDMGLEGSEERTLETLSGGEQRRVALARAIVSHADLLVLDEPTNHLDLETIETLEERLLEQRATVVFVTHDRAFLDHVATRLIEVDRGTLYSFEGVYADYLERKAERFEREMREEASRKNVLRRELAWLRRGTRAQRTKNKDHVARVESLAAERPKEQDGEVELALPTGPRLGSTILELSHVTKSLGGRVLIRDLSLRIDKGDRIGVVGKNGVGKTTLIKLLTGEEKPDSGTVTVGPNTRFVHARQQKDDLDPELTVHEAVGHDSDWITIGDQRITVRAYLLRFLFPSEQLRMKVGRLSGGERSRVQLARMLRDGGNFVILDEPTNDLDLPTLRVLENALVTFPGVVLTVSHDRAFLGQVATRVLGFEENGHVEVSDGGYDMYVERLHRRRAEAKAREAATKKAQGPAKAAASEGPKKLTWKEQRELEELEGKKIPEGDAAVAVLLKRLEDPAIYAGDAREARTVADDLRKKQDEVKKLYARWEELEGRR
jgi:ATP-binding cassette subfamily F protein uup